jgi:hypothetical protein
MITRAALHCLIDDLPDTSLAQAEYVLNLVRDLANRAPTPIREDDPVWLAMQRAPDDDEPLTAEEIAVIEEAEAELAQVGGIPWEMIRLRQQLLD